MASQALAVLTCSVLGRPDGDSHLATPVDSIARGAAVHAGGLHRDPESRWLGKAPWHHPPGNHARCQHLLGFDRRACCDRGARRRDEHDCDERRPGSDGDARLAEAARLFDSLTRRGPAVLCGKLNRAAQETTLAARANGLGLLAPHSSVGPVFPAPAYADSEARSGAALGPILGRGVAVGESGMSGNEPERDRCPSDDFAVWARIRTRQ